jgi:hypothetical protein
MDELDQALVNTLTNINDFIIIGGNYNIPSNISWFVFSRWVISIQKNKKDIYKNFNVIIQHGRGFAIHRTIIMKIIKVK